MTADMRAWIDPEEPGLGFSLEEKGRFTHPVIWVDPENDEHMKAIFAALNKQGWSSLRDALRSLLTPPKQKPAEPDHFGAMVRDKGVQYVAFESRDGHGWRWAAEDGGSRTWDQFSNDVEVLS